MDNILLLIGLSLLLIAIVIVLGYYGIKYRIWLMRKLNAPFRYKINPKKPLTETPGKLIRKIKDTKTDYRAIVLMKNYQHMHMKDNPNLTRYYLTFETFKGYKSFTVSEEVYKKYNENKYGIIRHQKSKFHSFTYRQKEDIMQLKNTT